MYDTRANKQLTSFYNQSYSNEYICDKYNYEIIVSVYYSSFLIIKIDQTFTIPSKYNHTHCLRIFYLVIPYFKLKMKQNKKTVVYSIDYNI